MSSQQLAITGMSCAACQQHVQRALETVPGVESASVNLLSHTAQVRSAEAIAPAELVKAVRGAGYGARVAGAAEDVEASAAKNDASVGWRAAFALTAGAVAMVLSMPLMGSADSSDPLLRVLMAHLLPLEPQWMMALPVAPLRWVLCALAMATMVFAAPQIYMAAWTAARHHSTNMNTLVALGTLAALLSSFAVTLAPGWLARHNVHFEVYYEATILILGFLLLGRWLEEKARQEATASLRGFAQLQAVDARFLSAAGDPAVNLASAAETLLPLDAIEVGDLLRILPGDRVPVDAVIVYGQSSLDESLLTGEPMPVTRKSGERIVSGSLNLDGPLAVRATAKGADSTVAQMRRMLEQAQTGRAPLQRVADRASAIFVPCVLVLALATFVGWAIAGNSGGRHEGFGLALTLMVAVLIVACPCAMGLAIPAAIAVAIGRVAQLGLLIKGPEAIERLAAIDTIALDKTGTLTEGKPAVANYERAASAKFEDQQILTWAAAAERASTHPLAVAIVAYAGAEVKRATATDVQVLPGVGIRANVDDHALMIGNSSPGVMVATKSEGTPVYLVVDGELQATLWLNDTIRPEAADAVAMLNRAGIRTTMLTGDTLAAAEPLAQQAGIMEIEAHLLPADKLQAIQRMQHAGRHVAMVGDGINDAAALAQADAGLAMAHGTDLAREAGDVLLLRDDLRLLPTALLAARRTLRVMRQNLFWALAYNALALPIAAGVLYPRFHILLSPVVGGGAMALSSVSVLANSLRLRRLQSFAR